MAADGAEAERAAAELREENRALLSSSKRSMAEARAAAGRVAALEAALEQRDEELAAVRDDARQALRAGMVDGEAQTGTPQLDLRRLPTLGAALSGPTSSAAKDGGNVDYTIARPSAAELPAWSAAKAAERCTAKAGSVASDTTWQTQPESQRQSRRGPTPRADGHDSRTGSFRRSYTPTPPAVPRPETDSERVAQLAAVAAVCVTGTLLLSWLVRR
jgi:hypothetical protein